MKPLALLATACTIAVASMTTVGAQEVTGTAPVAGAGSTFAYPLIAAWSKSYQRWIAGGGDYAATGSGLDDPPTGPALDYEPIGSLGGTMRVREGSVDFGASDAPLTSADLQKLKLIQFPIVVGGIVAVVNIDGVAPGALKLTGEIVADIYLGKVQTWADPAITALNPNLTLPDAKIMVFRRSDGSGTTFNFAHYLSKVSAQWRDTVGADLILAWPTGAGAKGNDGVSRAVRQTKNSIGYVEYAHAVQTKLSYAALRNRAGAFVTPDAASFQAAAASAEWDKASDFHLLLTDAPGEKAYPIVATVFVLMNKATSQRRSRATLNFFEWALDKGAKDASDLGYVPLPPALTTQIKSYWAKNLRAGS